MRRKEAYSHIDFGGSLILRDPYAIGLKENHNLKSQNVIQKSRAIAGLSGYQKYIKYPLEISGSVENKVRSIYRYTNADADTFQTLLHIDSDVYLVDEVNAIITPTSITPGGDTFNTDDIEWANYSGTLYFVDGALHGTTGLMKYNGTVISGVTVANSIRPRLLCTYFNRLIMASSPAYPNRIAWSDPGSPEAWDMTNNYIEVPVSHGGRVRKVIQYMDSLLIFNDKSILSIYGNQLPNTLSVLFENIGAASTKSVVVHGGNIFWFGNDGHIYMLRSGQFYDLTTLYLDRVPVDPDYMDQVVCWIEDDNLWVSFKDVDNSLPFNNALLICDFTDPRNPIWCGIHTGWRINCVTKYDYAEDTQDVVYGDSYCAMLWKRSDDYIQGAGISTLVNDASATTTEIDIDVTNSDITTYNLDQANALSGCYFEVGNEGEVIKTSTVASSNKVTVTLRAALLSAPADDAAVYIGREEMIYQTVQNIFKSLFDVKYIDKLYIQARSISGNDINVTLLHNGAATGNLNTVDLSSDQALFDVAIFDVDVFSADDQVLCKEIDYHFEEEYGWQTSVQFQNESSVNKTLEVVGMAILYQVEELVRNTG